MPKNADEKAIIHKSALRASVLNKLTKLIFSKVFIFGVFILLQIIAIVVLLLRLTAYSGVVQF